MKFFHVVQNTYTWVTNVICRSVVASNPMHILNQILSDVAPTSRDQTQGTTPARFRSELCCLDLILYKSTLTMDTRVKRSKTCGQRLLLNKMFDICSNICKHFSSLVAYAST